jgi:MYXO-CTERM domain-containing protein
LVVDGAATLDGALDVSLVNLGAGAFIPNLGNVFSILTAEEIGGEFSSFSLPALAANKMWQVTYDPTAVLLKVTIPGDFDGDFTVEYEDIEAWPAGFGSLYSGLEFLAWQRNLGMSVSPVAAVPEPTAAALAAMGLVGIVLRRRAA